MDARSGEGNRSQTQVKDHLPGDDSCGARGGSEGPLLPWADRPKGAHFVFIRAEPGQVAFFTERRKSVLQMLEHCVILRPDKLQGHDKAAGAPFSKPAKQELNGATRRG